MSEINFKDVMTYIENATADEICEIHDVIVDKNGYFEREIELEDVEDFINNAFSSDVEQIVEICKDLGYTTEPEEDELELRENISKLSLSSKMELEELLINFFTKHKHG